MYSSNWSTERLAAAINSVNIRMLRRVNSLQRIDQLLVRRAQLVIKGNRRSENCIATKFWCPQHIQHRWNAISIAIRVFLATSSMLTVSWRIDLEGVVRMVIGAIACVLADIVISANDGYMTWILLIRISILLEHGISDCQIWQSDDCTIPKCFVNSYCSSTVIS